MTRRRALFVACGVALGATAGTCEEYPPVLSSDVATRDMGLSFEVTATATASEIAVRLDGPGGAVRLVAGDSLLVLPARGATPQRLAPLGDGLYRTIMPQALDTFVLRLDRTEPAESAEIARAIPAATTLVAPSTWSRAEPLTVEWVADPGPHQTSVALIGDCVRPVTRNIVSDPGRYTFQAADFEPSDATCTVTVTLRRTAPVGDTTVLRATSGLVNRLAELALESTP